MRTFPIGLLLAIFSPSIVKADDWPEWRGPYRTGVSHEKDVPSQWSHEKNVVWKAHLRGPGCASPIVWGDRIFLASQIGRGPVRQYRRSKESVTPSGTVRFQVQAFHRSDGRLLWEHEMERKGRLEPAHDKNDMASSSCVTDGALVYAWFGTGQLVALDVDGEVVWKRHLAARGESRVETRARDLRLLARHEEESMSRHRLDRRPLHPGPRRSQRDPRDFHHGLLGHDYSAFEIRWGHASSPILYKDLVILLCDHTPASYLLALDKRTGRERWKVDRGSGRRSYSTPLVVRAAQGDELIVNSNLRIDSYRPLTGEWLWSAGEENRVPVPKPVYQDEVIYTSRGYRSGPYMAIRTGGRGDVSQTHVEWRVATGAPYVSSLLYYQGLIYMVGEQGIVSCIDAGNGDTVWRKRIGGAFSASPVAADGKIYLLNEEGETIVLLAGRDPKILARNELNERCLASPAISGGQIFIRSDQHLICIGD